ncbi:Bax inhibitor-1/YccA family protein [Lacticaseibacillus absianus]|uniref:Bax inhibitor-1/YccA family protein n=1 Tax=Lacticaseibacillus absianus TaxID=2729623 RepID=UPI0015C8EA22|nr:Bax inhibitor-1/YccA family protein [Lacticaseibacillus absianus]
MEERRVVNDTGLAAFFNRVYSTVGLGIAVTSLISYLLGTVFVDSYTSFINSSPLMFWLMTLMPFILLFVMNNKAARRSGAYATVVFTLISASFGFMYASLFIRYELGTMTAALLTTAVAFITMSVVGRVTKQDLSRAGAIASNALIGIILVTLINVFLIHSSGMQLIMAYVILIVFLVLTAWDNQALKRMYLTAGQSGQPAYSMNSLAIQGALMLYLDFLNMFMAILQIFGGGSDRN